MVKVYFLVAFLIVVAASTMAAPIDREFESLEVAVPDGHGKRQKRLVCDVLEMTGNMACAGHCMSMGKVGGHCVDHICICRDETIIEHLGEHIHEMISSFKTPEPLTNADFQETMTWT